MIIVNTNFSKFKNRGLELERLLSNTFNSPEFCRHSLIEKYPTPIQILEKNNTYITKAFFKKDAFLDFVGIYKKHYIEIEAKTTEKEKLNKGNIKDTQFERAQKILSQGGLIYFVIEYKRENKYYIIKGMDFLQHFNKKSSLSIEEADIIGKPLKIKSNLSLDLENYL